MGLYPQPNKWSCGPFALKHALIMLGKTVSENDISRIAGTHWWAGTDEIKLTRAARAYDCQMLMIRRKHSLPAKRELLLALKRGHPSLLCVDGWNHWITVVGAEKGKFIIIDSREAPVVCITDWRSLRRRWVYQEADEDDPTLTKNLYDHYPVVPRFRLKTKAHFSLQRARYLRQPQSRSFATHWDEYFNDLITICTPRSPRQSKVFPLGELFRRHGVMISDQIAYWHGSVKRTHLQRILRNLKFVADTYDLVVRAEDEKRAIAAVTANLALWAASKYGVGEVYGNS
jgi:hypothetical protein